MNALSPLLTWVLDHIAMEDKKIAASMQNSTVPLGTLLVSRGLLSEKQLSVALSQQRVTGAVLGETLISLGFLTPQELAQAIAEQSGLEYLDLRNYTLSDQALRVVPKGTALKHGYIPLEVQDGVLSIGIMNPSNVVAVDSAFHLTGEQPRVFLVDQDAYSDIFERAYYFTENSVQQRLEAFSENINNGTRRASYHGRHPENGVRYPPYPFQ
jgi:hypothetical protein